MAEGMAAEDDTAVVSVGQTRLITVAMWLHCLLGRPAILGKWAANAQDGDVRRWALECSTCHVSYIIYLPLK